MMSARKSLSNFLTSPCKIAHALDWRKASGGSILSMSIGRESIDLAVAQHPEESEDGPRSLPSVPVDFEFANRKKILSANVAGEIGRIASDFQVCGTIVSWPVQQEGWAGAPCGRVLFTLEQLASAKTGAINNVRKVCLWNDSHKSLRVDEWGRNPSYAHGTSKSIHFASREQYLCSETDAADVWNDFRRVHWPECNNSEYFDKQQEMQPSPKSLSPGAAASLHSVTDNGLHHSGEKVALFVKDSF
jgi:hypothetical protein